MTTQHTGPLHGRRVVVGITGSIAAFKGLELIRLLRKQGAQVRVCATPAALRFVGLASLEVLSAQAVFTDLWQTEDGREPHVELALWAEAMVVAPATRQCLAKLVHGGVDDPVSATAACLRVPLLLAPAMHTHMWEGPCMQRLRNQLRDDGRTVLGPVTGELANGAHGDGRMCEVETLVAALSQALAPQDLSGLQVLISAGPTIEDLDPVRFLSNRATGMMGFALATVAAQRGANVTLVAGPTTLTTPAKVQRQNVRSAADMHTAIVAQWQSQDVVIMSAAVADFRAAQPQPYKIKKQGQDQMTLVLERTPDILAELGTARIDIRSNDAAVKTPMLVGFAAESHDAVAAARRKLAHKHIDLVVANTVPQAFGAATVQATLVEARGETSMHAADKYLFANQLWTHLCAQHRPLYR